LLIENTRSKEDVAAAELAAGQIDDALAVTHRAELSRMQRDHRSAGCTNETHGFFSRLRAQIAADDRSPFAGKPQRYSTANASARSGNYADLALKPIPHRLLYRNRYRPPPREKIEHREYDGAG
jgi:hypothetical protein